NVIIMDGAGSVLEMPLAVLGSPEKSFTIQMPALNVSQWIDLEMIADGEIEYPILNGSLRVGSQPIMAVAGRQRQRLRSRMRGVVGLGIFVATVGFGLLGWQAFSNPEGPSIWPGVLIALGSIVTIGAAAAYGWSWGG